VGGGQGFLLDGDAGVVLTLTTLRLIPLEIGTHYSLVKLVYFSREMPLRFSNDLRPPRPNIPKRTGIIVDISSGSILTE